MKIISLPIISVYGLSSFRLALQPPIGMQRTYELLNQPPKTAANSYTVTIIQEPLQEALKIMSK